MRVLSHMGSFVIRHTSNVDICGCWAWTGEHTPSQMFECDDGNDGSYPPQTLILLAIILRRDPARRLRPSAGRDQQLAGRPELGRPTDVRTVHRFLKIGTVGFIEKRAPMGSSQLACANVLGFDLAPARALPTVLHTGPCLQDACSL